MTLIRDAAVNRIGMNASQLHLFRFTPFKYMQLNQQMGINDKSYCYAHFSLKSLTKQEKNVIVFDLVLPTPR